MCRLCAYFSPFFCFVCLFAWFSSTICGVVSFSGNILEGLIDVEDDNAAHCLPGYCILRGTIVLLLIVEIVKYIPGTR